MKFYIQLVLSLFTSVIMAQEKIEVGVFVYEGMELQDFAGPTDVFIKANRFSKEIYNVHLFSIDGKPIKTERKEVGIIPDYTLENLPKVDLVIIPGAPMDVIQELSTNIEVQQFLQAKQAQDITLASVCTGAFFLANANLLEGKKYTTHYLRASILEKQLVNSILVRNVRFVDSGKILTGSGITSGIDLALYLVGRYSGEDVLNRTAETMQYSYSSNQQWPEAQ